MHYAATKYSLQDRALAEQAWPRYPDRELDGKSSYKTVEVIINSDGAVVVCLIILCPNTLAPILLPTNYRHAITILTCSSSHFRWCLRAGLAARTTSQ